MKRIIFISLIIAHCALNIGEAYAQNDIYTVAGRTKILQFKNSGDYTAYTLLFVAENSAGERVIQKTLSATYSVPYTTMTCTLYVSDTEDFTTDASYPYDIAAYGADTVQVRQGNLNILSPVQTSFDGLNLPEDGTRIISVSLDNGTIQYETIYWDTTLAQWEPSGTVLNPAQSDSMSALIADTADVLRSELLANNDSTLFRTFSDSKYLANGDSTSFRTFSDSKYLANGDSTLFRTFSDLKYLLKTDTTAQRTFSDLKYLLKTDTTAQRTFSDLKYLIKTDTTAQRTFSDLKYLLKTDTTAQRTFSDLKYLLKTDTTAQRTFSDLKYPTKTAIGDSDFVKTTETSAWDKNASDDFVKGDTVLTLATQADIAIKVDEDFSGYDKVTPEGTDLIVINQSGVMKNAATNDLPVSSATSAQISSSTQNKTNIDAPNYNIYGTQLLSYSDFWQAFVDSMKSHRALIESKVVVIDSPAVPIWVSVVAGTGATATITLTWTQAGSYDSVEVSYSTGGAYSIITYIDSGTVTYAHTVQPSGQTNFYRLRAINGGTYSNYSAVLSGKVTEAVEGAGWFVSSTTAGNASGDSWDNKASIYTFNWTLPEPGDTIWVDGGTDSLVYSGLALEPAQTTNIDIWAQVYVLGLYGTVANPIVITKGLSAGYNGTPIFEKTSGWSGDRNYNWYFHNCGYIELSYIKINVKHYPSGYGIKTTISVNNISFLHNYIDYRYGWGTQLDGNYHTFEYNTFTTPSLTGAEFTLAQTYQSDAIKSNTGDNYTIAYNSFINRTSIPLNQEGAHRDFIQLESHNLEPSSVSYIYNNFILGNFTDDSVAINTIKANKAGGTWYVYNNIILIQYGCNDMFSWDKSSAASSPLNVNVYNNTIIVTEGKQTDDRGSTYQGTISTDVFRFKNNLYYAENGYAFASLTAPTLDFDYNQYLFANFRSAKTWTAWTTSDLQDVNSGNAGFILDNDDYTSISSTVFTENDSDYAIASGSAGLNDAADLSSIFQLDYEDSTRNVWDAGAFEDNATGSAPSNPELVSNGTFATSVTDWYGVSNVSSVSYIDTAIATVSNILELEAIVTSGTSNVRCYTYLLSNLVVGTTYTVTYKYYIPSTNTTSVRLQSYAYGTTSEQIAIETTTDAWTTRTISYTPTGENKDRLFFRMFNSANSAVSTIGDVMYINDVSVIEQ